MFRFLPEFDLYLGEAWRKSNEALGIPIPTISDDPPCFKKEAEIFFRPLGGLTPKIDQQTEEQTEDRRTLELSL